MTKLILTIVDGYGYREEIYGNATKQASTPNIDFLMNNYPYTLLTASGEEVGLPKGQMGNSEVGHLNIGAGRVVYQPLQELNNQVKNNTFLENKKIRDVLEHVKNNDSSLHIFGLLSDGGVHSHINHLFAIIDICKKEDVENVYYHVALDGRDTLPNIKEKFLKQLDDKIKETKIGSLATVSGRYYSMDRDNNWDRIKEAYDAMLFGEGNRYNNYQELILECDKNETTDEFVKPSIINESGMISDNDGILVFNFRPDRLRELLTAITNKEFSEFKTKDLKNIRVVTMYPISNDAKTISAFELGTLNNTFGKYISSKGLAQLRIAETEKYAHVTYFFDGEEDEVLPLSKRILVPSPKVKTYDLKPEMSANIITEKLLEEMENFDVVILNFANCDMVGHTGNLDATIKGLEIVDYNIGKIYKKAEEINATMIVTADHGNCEVMLNENNGKVTAHTTSPVPFIVTRKDINLKTGKLGDIAPTMLELLNLEKPEEMTGESLIIK